MNALFGVLGAAVVPLLRPGRRERDHGLRPADAALDAGRLRGGRRARALRRHRLGVRAARRRGAGRGRGAARARRGGDRARGSARVRRALAARARARARLRPLLPAARARRPRRQQEALRRLGSDGRLVVVGLESVRRDWPAVARRLQQGMLERALHRTATWRPSCATSSRELRAGELDAELVYAKRIRKGASSATTPTRPTCRPRARRAARPAA